MVKCKIRTVIKMRIAVCDDEPTILNLLHKLIAKELKANNLYFESILIFESGYKLLNEYIQTPFDVIFLDIRMPDLSGFDIAAKLSYFKREKLSCLSFD